MFKVKWNVQNNGIILSDNITDDEAIPAPRPVYLQELQMLEVNKKYRMPKTDLPICWNIDARYYIIKVSLFLREEGQVSIASQM